LLNFEKNVFFMNHVCWVLLQLNCHRASVKWWFLQSGGSGSILEVLNNVRCIKSTYEKLRALDIENIAHYFKDRIRNQQIASTFALLRLCDSLVIVNFLKISFIYISCFLNLLYNWCIIEPWFSVVFAILGFGFDPWIIVQF
jgi:hypothetical protein